MSQPHNPSHALGFALTWSREGHGIHGQKKERSSGQNSLFRPEALYFLFLLPDTHLNPKRGWYVQEEIMSPSAERCLEDWMEVLRVSSTIPKTIELDDLHFNLLHEAAFRLTVVGLDTSTCLGYPRCIAITIGFSGGVVKFRRAS